jgi:hypothetical protein
MIQTDHRWLAIIIISTKRNRNTSGNARVSRETSQSTNGILRSLVATFRKFHEII